MYQRIFRIILLLCLIVVSSAILHEGGHVIVMFLNGMSITRVVIAPGIQIYPVFTRVEWTGFIIGLGIERGFASDYQNGLCYVMGSGTTALCSYLLLLIVYTGLHKLRKQTIVILLILSSIWASDIITYSIFPALGLKHFIFLGGSMAEPIVGVTLMNIPKWISYSVILVHALLYYFLLIVVIKKIVKLDNENRLQLDGLKTAV